MTNQNPVPTRGGWLHQTALEPRHALSRLKMRDSPRRVARVDKISNLKISTKDETERQFLSLQHSAISLGKVKEIS